MAPTSKSDPAVIEASVNLTAPRATLDTAIDAARLANPLITMEDGRTFVLHREDHRLQETTHPDAKLPPYIKQSLTVDNRTSLEAYVNRFSSEQSILIADYDKGTLCAALDYHGDNAQGALDAGPVTHRCTLVLRPSEEFKRWNEFQGKLHAQAEFAAFLEENATDVVHPEPAVLIEISRDLEGIQGVNFKSSTRLENGDRAFTYETETKTKGGVSVPREFTLNIPVYNGEEPTYIRCALRWRIVEGGLGLGFEWRRVEYQRRAYFNQLATAAAEATGCPVFFGRITS